MKLKDSRILLGVTGGIAAYKAADLCRHLIKAGANVRVVMTSAAEEFVRPLTFQALSHNPVHTTLLDPEAEAGMGHIELAKWADLVLVAPATADLIARYHAGMANDLLTTILVATESPVCLAPAMNQAMWSHPITQRNLSGLHSVLGANLTVLGPQSGEQACGDVGPGRMMEPLDIIAALHDGPSTEYSELDLSGQRVVITAGPTREALDPVRYISNHSSGKMGFALASECQRRGALVTLIAGPVQLEAPTEVEVIDVESANDMHEQVMREIKQGCDIFIASAAVADYRPAEVATSKMKKSGDDISIALIQNPDIVASVGASSPKPFTVGFAAETNDVKQYAKSKLKKKNLDMIVANDVSNPEIGFNSNDNEVCIIWGEGERLVPRQAKSNIASEIVNEIVRLK